MCVKGTYGKQHMERTELSVMSYVQRMSYDGSMATSDSGFSCSSPGDKVTWRFSSQPLYLQVSSRIDFAKTSTVQTELGFELSTLCVQAFYCWLWRVPGLLPLSESGWVHSLPPPPIPSRSWVVNVSLFGNLALTAGTFVSLYVRGELMPELEVLSI